jgi:hypothetical protein
VYGWIAAGALVALHFLINVIWKPYLKTYAEEAAKEFAKSERFQEAFRQLELTTRRTAEIQSDIAGGLWLSQWRINQKRDSYLRLIESIENWQLVRSESRRRSMDLSVDEERAIDEFRRARSIARLILEPRVVDGIGRIIREVRSVSPWHSGDEEFAKSTMRIQQARDNVVATGKIELKLDEA